MRMTNLKRKAVIFLCMLSFCLSFMLIGVPEIKADSSDIELQVWFSSFEAENQALREIAKKYKEKTNVKVEVYSSNFFDISSRFPNAAETAERPDIIFMQSSDLGSLVESGYVMPMDFLDNELLERYNNLAIDGFTYQGGHYGMGYSSDSYGILYNKALVEEPPKTWEELFKVAKELTVRDGNTVRQWGFLLNGTNMWFTYPLLKLYGGYYMGVDESGSYNALDIGLNSVGMIDGIQRLKELQSEHMVLENRNQTDSHIVSRFADGNVAMTFYGLWNAELFQENKIDYGIAPLPKDLKGVRSKALSTVQGFAINKFTNHPDEAKDFFKYILEDENQQYLYEAANGFDKKSGIRNTCNIAVSKSQYVKSSEVLSAFYEIGNSSEVFPNNPEGTIIWNYSQGVMSSILYEDADIEGKMSEFQAKVEQDIAQMNRDSSHLGNDNYFYKWFFIILASLSIVAIIIRLILLCKRGNIKNTLKSPKTTLIAWGMLLPFISMLLFFYVYPIVDNVNLSFTNYSSLNLRDYEFIGTENYNAIFTDGLDGFISMFIWTVTFALSVVAISFLIGTILAVILHKRDVRVAKVYRLIFILPWAIPSVITLLMWQGLLDSYDGLINNILGIFGLGPVPFLIHPIVARLSTIFVMSWFTFPYYLTVSQGIISNIPTEYYEAMYIDGGNSFSCYRKITVPIVIRSIFPILILGFIMQFNQFGVYMLTGGGPAGETLGSPGATDLLITYIFNQAFNVNQYGLAAAYSVIIFIFLGVFTLVTMHLVEGKRTKAPKKRKTRGNVV